MASLPQNACGRLHRAMTTGKTRCLLVVLLHVALVSAPALAQDATWEKALGPEHPNVATSLQNYARCFER